MHSFHCYSLYKLLYVVSFSFFSFIPFHSIRSIYCVQYRYRTSTAVLYIYYKVYIISQSCCCRSSGIIDLLCDFFCRVIIKIRYGDTVLCEYVLVCVQSCKDDELCSVSFRSVPDEPLNRSRFPICVRFSPHVVLSISPN